MNMDYEHLNTMLMNEYNDVITYVTLSKNANDSESQIFRDIAKEEYIHAKHIKQILIKAGKLEDGFDKLETNAKEALESV